MISTRLVLRLLDDQSRLLGWGYMETHARGDGALWPASPCQGHGELTGTVTTLVVHWPDLHLQATAPIQAFAIQQGQVFAFAWTGGPILRLDNPADHPELPPVIVREPIVTSVPPGALGATGLR